MAAFCILMYLSVVPYSTHNITPWAQLRVLLEQFISQTFQHI